MLSTTPTQNDKRAAGVCARSAAKMIQPNRSCLGHKRIQLISDFRLSGSAASRRGISECRVVLVSIRPSGVDMIDDQWDAGPTRE